MSNFPQGLSETRESCPLPPYNTLNFNSSSPVVFSTLQSFAKNSPNYPLPPGSNASQITGNAANVSYFNAINQQAIDTRNLVKSGLVNLPYPRFQTEGQRLQYLQGQMMTSARSILVPDMNPVAPAGVPLSTIGQILNS
jgi:hypothetical protein